MKRVIGIDARTIFTHEITGIGTYVLKLVQFLQQQGTRLTLFTNTVDEDPPGLDFSRITVAHSSGQRYAWEVRALPRLIRHNPVDLYHATWNFGVPITKSPTILTLYDVIPLVLKKQYAKTFKSKVDLALYRFFVRQSVRRSSRVITISETSKRDIVKYFPDSQSKIDVIPLAAEETPNATALPGPGIPDGQYLLYFGGFERRKNVEIILSSFPTIQQRFPEIRLVLVGKKNQYYRDHLRSYKNMPGIKFTDYLDRTALNILIAHATIVIYPSRYEGFGLPILEAMRFGTPVITSNTSALAEIAHGAAEIVDPDNSDQLVSAITKLLADKPHREDLGTRGKQRAAEYTWKKTFKATWDVYEKLLPR